MTSPPIPISHQFISSPSSSTNTTTPNAIIPQNLTSGHHNTNSHSFASGSKAHNKNPELPCSTFQFSEVELRAAAATGESSISCSPHFQALLESQNANKPLLLNEKIKIIHQWQKKTSTMSPQEISYLMTILLDYDLKVFHKHAYNLLVTQWHQIGGSQEQKNNMLQTIQQEVHLCLEYYLNPTQLSQLGNFMQQWERVIIVLGGLMELGQDMKQWMQKNDMMRFFVTVLEHVRESFEDKMRGVQQMEDETTPLSDNKNHSSSSTSDTIISTVLSAQQVRFIMLTCRSMGQIIAKQGISDIQDDILERIINYLIPFVICNQYMSPDAKRLATIMFMNILHQKQLNDSTLAQRLYQFLRESFFAADAHNLERATYQPTTAGSSYASSTTTNFYQQLVIQLCSKTMQQVIQRLNTIGYICLIRATVAVCPLETLVLPNTDESNSTSLIIDGFIPLLIQQSNNPTEGSEQLYAIHALQLCVAQLTNYCTKHSTPEQACHMEERIVKALKDALDIVWNNWENPVTNIADRVREVFQSVIDAHASLSRSGQQLLNLEQLSSFLLHTNWNRKGKYTCLNLLLPIIGAKKFLQIEPNLFVEVLKVMGNISVSTSGSYFYADIARELLMDAAGEPTSQQKRPTPESSSAKSGKKKRKFNPPKNLDISPEALAQWRTQCVDPLLDIIVSTGTKKIRQRVIMYVAVKLAKLHPDTMSYILEQLHQKSSTSPVAAHRCLKALAHLLMLSKKSRLAPLSVIEEYYEHLEEAFIHSDEDVRTHSIEAITASPKSSICPTEREMEMAFRFLVANLRNCPGNYRTRLVEIFKKYFMRVRDSSRNIFVRYKKADMAHCLYTKQDTTIANLKASKADYVRIMKFIAKSMKAIEESLYPGCPHEKILVAIELYQQATKAFKNEQDTLLVFSRGNCTPEERIIPYVQLYGSNFCNSFLNANFDCWDRIRAYIYNVLADFPTPLPEYDTPERLNFILNNAQKLMERPRLRESDAGALVLRLIFKKYICELGWHLEWKSNGSMCISDKNSSSQASAVLNFLRTLTQRLKERMENIRKDIFSLTKSDPLIGILIALRYALEDIDMEKFSQKDRQAWRSYLEEFSTVIRDVTYFSIQMLADARSDNGSSAYSSSTPLQQSTSSEMEAQKKALISSNPDLQVDCRGHVYFSDSEYARVDVHALVVNCWLSIRETTMLVGVISQKVRLSSSKDGSLFDDCLLSTEYFERMGTLFMDILMNTKHNGAIDKSHVGFQMLCSRLLTCNVPQLAALPGKWLSSLIGKIENNEASILRRSGGFPFIFTAILKSEPQSVPPVLMKRAIKDLLRLCKTDCKSRKVNSLNILRFLFRDAELGVTILQHAQEAFMLALDGFCHDTWGVRNSSLMLYSALIQRTIGSIKVRDNVQAAQNCVTSREFFSKYPKLRDYLLNQLQIATAQHDARELHPNMYPILLLLSRLTAAAIDDPNDPLSVGPFITLVKNCAHNRNHMARSMAARALVPLVASSIAHEFVLNLIAELDRAQSTNHCHGILLQIYGFVIGGTLFSQHNSERTLPSTVSALSRHASYLMSTCPSIRKAYSDIIDVLQQRAQSTPGLYENTFLSNESESLSKQLSECSFLQEKLQPHLTGLDVALGARTKVHLTHLNEKGLQDKLEASLLICIDHWSTNVVVESLKTIVDVCTKTINFSASIYAAISALLRKPTVDAEQVKYALQALKSLCKIVELNQICTKLPDMSEAWNQIYSIHRDYTSCYIRAHSLEILGIFLATDGSNTTRYEQWIQLAKASCQPDQPNELRFSCQASVAESKTLSHSLDAWIVAMTLCQDDNEDIRTAAAYNVTPYIFGKAKNMQVEYVIDKGYSKMGLEFGKEEAFAQHLWSLILLPQQQDGTPRIPFENLTLDLFDEESDNLFEEGKFRLDLATRELLKLPKELRDLRVPEAVQQLQQVVKALKQTNVDSIVSIGGRTYNGDVFSPLYCLLVGATLGDQSSNKDSLLQDVKSELKEILSEDEFVHPMIAEYL